MNITQYSPNLSIATITNKATESLVRENIQRDLITQPAAMSQSAAEKGVASESSAKKEPSAKKDKYTSDKQAKSNTEEDENQSSIAEHKKLEQEKAEKEHLIDALKQRDAEVRKHEQAHHAAGGSTTGMPSYSFTTGPDGQRYATDGEVAVDLSIKQGDPAGTITKMQQVKAAALAPANPSIQDLRVASSASQITLQAQAELIRMSKDFVEADNNKELSASSASGVDTEESVKSNEGFESKNVIDEKGVDEKGVDEKNFDDQISQTIAAQEAVSPHKETLSRPPEVLDRSGRISLFYNKISHAYDNPVPHQIEVMA